MNTHVCRFCRQNRRGESMVKYATRHYAHYRCWLSAKMIERQELPIQEVIGSCLHAWQIRNFPVMVVADYINEVLHGMGSAMTILKQAIEISEGKVTAR